VGDICKEGEKGRYGKGRLFRLLSPRQEKEEKKGEEESLFVSEGKGNLRHNSPQREKGYPRGRR